MRQTNLIEVDKYTELAEWQREQVMGGPQPPKPLCLTAAEWQSTAAFWMLIRSGVYIPLLEKKILKRLRCNNTRNECETWIRMHRMTLEQAAEIAYCEDDLKRYNEVESRRPVLV